MKLAVFEVRNPLTWYVAWVCGMGMWYAAKRHIACRMKESDAVRFHSFLEIVFA